MWNPSTGFFKKLPDPDIPRNDKELSFYGVGYLPATDDFVILVVSGCYSDDKHEAAIFSSKANAWTTIKVDLGRYFVTVYYQGTLLKEALHWPDNHNAILAFDLAQQEGRHKFRKMLLPRDFNVEDDWRNFSLVGVSAGGCLSVARCLNAARDCIEVWIMREYDVRDSWTKLFNLKISDPPKERWQYFYNRGLLMETGMLAVINLHENMSPCALAKILYKEDECSLHRVVRGLVDMIQYQDSLLRIDD